MTVESYLVMSVQKAQILQWMKRIQFSISYGRLAGLGINQTLPLHSNHSYSTTAPHMEHKSLGCAPLSSQQVKAVPTQVSYNPFTCRRPEKFLSPKYHIACTSQDVFHLNYPIPHFLQWLKADDIYMNQPTQNKNTPRSLQKLSQALGSWCADTVAYVLSNDVSLFPCAPLPISCHLFSLGIHLDHMLLKAGLSVST